LIIRVALSISNLKRTDDYLFNNDNNGHFEKRKKLSKNKYHTLRSVTSKTAFSSSSLLVLKEVDRDERGSDLVRKSRKPGSMLNFPIVGGHWIDTPPDVALAPFAATCKVATFLTCQKPILFLSQTKLSPASWRARQLAAPANSAAASLHRQSTTE